jgi:hypothetical protein
MRKLLFFPLVFIAANVLGQVAPPPPGAPPQNGMQPEFIVTVQIGTDTLKNGKDTVKLAPQTLMEMKQAMANPNYVVMLTPRGECGQLSLVETREKYFLVRELKGSGPGNAMFDYTVVVKQKRPMMPMRPMPPQPPPAEQSK